MHMRERIQVKEISADKLSVGAVNWDGAFVMVAYLATLPLTTFRDKKVLELGAGPGMPGLFAAKLGSHSTITDLPKIVPLIERNIEANRLTEAQPRLSRKGAQEPSNARLHRRGVQGATGPQWRGAEALQTTQRRGAKGGADGEVAGSAVAAVLQWGVPGDVETVAALSEPRPDILLACDTCYLDPVRLPPLSPCRNL
jgi:predicted nicotinamide N-methyase